MKIAVITIAYNEDYQFDSWKSYYEEYMDEVNIHIIVDNNSRKEYKEMIRNAFPNSVYIESEKNTGTTGAYNLGVKYALKDGADAIMFVSQDIRLGKECISGLYDLLFSEDKIGMVAPLLLSGSNKEIIEQYGCTLDTKTLGVSLNFINRRITNDLPDTLEVNFIAGGINMTKSEVYEKIGLLDEDLFMYGEEADWGLRVIKGGYKMVVTKKCLSWHEHIFITNSSNKSKFRSPMSFFLINRNRLALVRKYNSRSYLFFTILKMFYEFPRVNFRLLINFQFKRIYANILGVFYGALGKMNIPEIFLR
jgi:GT2 family glycosyltransferase